MSNQSRGSYGSEEGQPSERAGAPCFCCIDLKSFYASVECVERGLDPLTARLVVADPSRTDRTICLAVSPPLKALGIKNRCRLYQIPQDVPYVVAKPRMRLYMQRSAEIYSIYLGHFAEKDIHPYSVDEAFIDLTGYQEYYGASGRELVEALRAEVMERTGITATAGVGTNLFLAKVAMDVMAKKSPGGVAELDEETFKRELWFHRPITDIWRVGPGIAHRLQRYGVEDLAGVAAMDETLLLKELGTPARHLIDHAWGQEPCTIADIKAYRPRCRSINNGQTLCCDYSFEEAEQVLCEMADESIWDLAGARLLCGSVSLRVGYQAPPGSQDKSNLYLHSGGDRRLPLVTDRASIIKQALLDLYRQTTWRGVPVRRLVLCLGDVRPARGEPRRLWEPGAQGWVTPEKAEQERRLERAVAAVRRRYGRDALLKATSYEPHCTARERAHQVGGHHE